MFVGSINVTVEGTGKQSEQILTASAGQLSVLDLAKFLRAKLIEISLLTLKDEQTKGFDKNPVRVVDGNPQKSLEDVKPFGQVEYVARVEVSKILEDIYKGLNKRSPQKTGTYYEANYVFLNGQEIARNPMEFESFIKSGKVFKEGDVIRFVNVMPYAGKLERNGVTIDRQVYKYKKATDKRQRSGSFVRAPNGTYFLTSRSILRKFKFNSKIEFQWINGAAMDLSGAPQTTKTGKKLRRTFAPRPRGRKGSYVYPSIVIFVGKDGII